MLSQGAEESVLPGMKIHFVMYLTAAAVSLRVVLNIYLIHALEDHLPILPE